jgi:glutamate racemase
MTRPIGIFDSGIGGISVLRAIQAILPSQPIIYLADQAHVPYGPRPLREVQALSQAITRHLLDQDAALIVVACNTASAAALHELRQTFPHVPFVGMEPAVKPAAQSTRSGVVGVLATPATFDGALYAATVERFASNVTILQNTCPGLVAEIESGQPDNPQVYNILENALRPMLAQGVDTIVLGCTHYPFVIPMIVEIVGPNIEVIDPAPAVALQVERLLGARSPIAEELHPNQVRYLTSGHPEAMHLLITGLTGDSQSSIEKVCWQDLQLIPCS